MRENNGGPESNYDSTYKNHNLILQYNYYNCNKNVFRKCYGLSS
jgi:hypothetical protein